LFVKYHEEEITTAKRASNQGRAVHGVKSTILYDKHEERVEEHIAKGSKKKVLGWKKHSEEGTEI